MKVGTSLRISLDGAWEFEHRSGERSAAKGQVRSIVVPGPWQAQFPDLRKRGGIGIYGWRQSLRRSNA